MYLTSEQYATIVGEAAPSDFDALLDLSEALIDLETLTYYAQVDVSSLPAMVQGYLRKAVAYQVQALDQAGGVAGATEQGVQSASLGKYSYTKGASATVLCGLSKRFLPYLMAYERGAQDATYS